MSDRDEVKDLLQDVFSALWQNRYSLTPESSLAGYRYATLRYKTIKLIALKKAETIYFDSLTALNQFSQPTDVAANGAIYVADLGKKRIRQIMPAE